MVKHFCLILILLLITCKAFPRPFVRRGIFRFIGSAAPVTGIKNFETKCLVLHRIDWSHFNIGMYNTGGQDGGISIQRTDVQKTRDMETFEKSRIDDVSNLDILKWRGQGPRGSTPTDLDIIINDNYNAQTCALNLHGAVKGINFFHVWARIKAAPFYDDIKHLTLSGNRFGVSFDSAFMQMMQSRFVFMFPPNLISLDLSSNSLSGTMFPFDALPHTLEQLNLQKNAFHGTIEWHLLPRKLRVLWIYDNDFDNIIEWGLLPPTLEVLGVSKSMAGIKPSDSVFQIIVATFRLSSLLHSCHSFMAFKRFS